MSQIAKQIANWPRMGWTALLLFVLLGAMSDVEHTVTQGGIDFRNRLIGARLLLAGEDPYWYKWKPGDSLRWLDPTDPPQKPMNRNTVSPTGLAIYAPMAPLVSA